ASAPPGLDRRRGLRLEVGSGECGRGRERRGGIATAGTAVGRAVDGGDEVIVRRRLEAAADRGEDRLRRSGAEGKRNARAPAVIAARIARVLRGDRAIRQRYRRVCRAERDGRPRGESVRIVVVPFRVSVGKRR